MKTLDFFYSIDGYPELCSTDSSVLLADRGLSYGHGLFETINYINSKFPLKHRHLSRMCTDAAKLGIKANEKKLDGYLSKFHDILVYHKFTGGVVKIILSAGPGGRGYQNPENINPNIIFRYSPSVAEGNLQRDLGVNLWRCEHQLAINKPLAGIKHLNRLDQVLARNEAHPNECDDGLMFDTNGCLVETTSANVFIKTQSHGWTTPDLSHCGVSGVMRSILIDEIFPELQLAVRINHITEIELSAASEIFICNSVKGIVPVTGILNQDQSKIKPIAIGSNTRDLQLMLAQLYPSFK